MDHCLGSRKFPSRKYRVQRSGGAIDVLGECHACGHLYSINRNGVLILHGTLGCVRTDSIVIIPSVCPRKGRPQHSGEIIGEITESSIEPALRRSFR